MLQRIMVGLGILASLVLVSISPCLGQTYAPGPDINITSTSQSDSSVCTDEPITITITASDEDAYGDPEPIIDTLTYTWYIETAANVWSQQQTGSSNQFTYSWASSGLKRVKCQVDDNGLYAQDTNPGWGNYGNYARIFSVQVRPANQVQAPGPGFSGLSGSCSTCQSDIGVLVNARTGQTLPAIVGEAADMADLPGTCPDDSSDPIDDQTCPSGSEFIDVGRSSVTLDASNNVLVNGVKRAGWSLSSDATTKTLTMSDGSKYQFSKSTGALLSSWGSSGMRKITYTYDTNYPDRIKEATDSYGNMWTYGVDPSLPGPSYAMNPDGTKKVTFSYVPAYSNGEGQWSQVILYYKSGDNWVEQYRMDYLYDSSDRVTRVTVTDPQEPLNPSVTNVEYVNGTEGDRSNPVRRICNTKMKVDTCFDYGTESIAEAYGGAKTYGYTQIRRRATCSSNTTYSTGDNNNSLDAVAKYYYYRDDGSTTDKYTYKIVTMEFDGSSGLQAYATAKYQAYGYLDRFAAGGGLPDDYQEEKLQGNPWKVVDARGSITTYEYSSQNGLVTKEILPIGHYTQYWYKKDGSNNDTMFVEKVRNTRGKYTRYTRDATYPVLVTKVEVSDNDSTYTEIKSMDYWDAGDTGYDLKKLGLLRQETVPDIEGTEDIVITYDYDETIDSTVYYRPSPTTSTYSWWNGSSYESKTSKTSYYSDGRIRWTEDALSNRTDYSYNSHLQVTNIWYPGDDADSGTVGGSTSTTIIDTSKSWYDDQLVGMALEIEGARYPVTDNTSTVITIDGTLSDVDGKSYTVRPYTEYTYSDCCGQVESQRNSRGKMTYYEYDSAGRLTKTWTDLSGQSSTYPLVQYAYNDLGQKTAVTTYSNSTTGRATSYTYDQLGRPAKIVYPYSSQESDLLWNEYYQYDKNGNLVAKLVGTIDRSGNITGGSVSAYEYDSLGRLSKVKHGYSASTWPLSSITITTGDVSYTYDAGSSLKTQMVDSSGTSSYTYDTVGRLSTYTPPLPANYIVEYSYNAAGQKTAVVVKESSANKYKTDYAYFKNGWLKQVKGQEYVSGNWTDKTRVDYSYDVVGRRIDKDNGLTLNDVLTDYVYNDRGQMKSITHAKSGDLYKLQYVRDGAGNPLQVAYSGSSFTQPYSSADKVRYEYDEISRLEKQEWGHISGSSWIVDHTADQWTYDWVGNRSPASSTWTYNAVDELTDTEGQQGVEYTYDMRGNLKYVPDSQNPTIQYVYNSDNLLSEVVYIDEYNNTNCTQIVWDADRHRVYVNKDFEDERAFIYDPTASIPAVLITVDITGSNTEIYSVREPGGGLLASFEADGADLHYYHFDGLGSTVLVTNGSGTVSDSYAYDAWGNALYGGDGLKPYQYIGKLGYYTHTSTQGVILSNLMQLGVRLYDSKIGRFFQRDIIKDGLNRYSYAYNNPIRHTDPSGMYTTKNCDDSQKKIIKSSIDIMIVPLLDENKTTCLDEEDKARLREKIYGDPDLDIEEIEIQCGGAQCKGKYGYYKGQYEPNTIHLCPMAFDGPKNSKVCTVVGGILGGITGAVAGYIYDNRSAPETVPGMPYIILHELLHTLGYDEDEVRRRAGKCFPDNDPK